MSLEKKIEHSTCNMLLSVFFVVRRVLAPRAAPDNFKRFIFSKPADSVKDVEV